MEYPEVFVFCWYQQRSNPRGIIANVSKFDDRTREEMFKMLSVGNIVETVTERNSLKVLGYRSSIDNRIIEDEEISRCFGKWSSLSVKFWMAKKSPEWMEFASGYCINDKNCNLSPIELYEKLTKLTSNPLIPEYKFTVKYCLLLSDVPLNAAIIKPLQFFIQLKEDNLVSEDIKAKLVDAFDVENVLLLSRDEGVLTPKTIEKWEELNNNGYELDFSYVIFV